MTNLSGSITFYVSSPVRPQAMVALTAQLAPSCLMIAPRTFDFGTFKLGHKSPTRSFRVYNTCGGPVTITGFRVQDAAGQAAGGANCPVPVPCPEFTLVSQPPTPPGVWVLNSNDPPLTFQLRYRPIDIGADMGTVAIDLTQNGHAMSYVIPVTGRADLQGIQTDVFEQHTTPKADVLLNIDDSSCNGYEQMSMALNYSAFMSYANQQRVDFRLAVTTTDNVSVGGRFVSGPGHPDKVLTPSTAKLQDQFTSKVIVGENGSATEMCFEPLLKALTPPLSLSDNAGFLRRDATLALVCMSDEEEQSPRPLSWYLEAFQNLKGFQRPGDFTFSAIAGFSSNCPYDAGEYSYMVEATNGVKRDVCTPDWTEAMKSIGQVAFGYRTRFHLSIAPDTTAGPIEVKVDGSPVPNLGWSYDPIANLVEIDPSYLPNVGSTLTISYPSLSVP